MTATSRSIAAEPEKNDDRHSENLQHRQSPFQTNARSRIITTSTCIAHALETSSHHDTRNFPTVLHPLTASSHPSINSHHRDLVALHEESSLHPKNKQQTQQQLPLQKKKKKKPTHHFFMQALRSSTRPRPSSIIRTLQKRTPILRNPAKATPSRTMAFFPRTFDDSSSFTPLFRLLDDFDSYSRQGLQQGTKRSGVAIWQPKFDVRETGDNYELHGELPGMNKDNVHLEFADPQTLIVRGRAERSYTSGTPPAGLLDQSNKAAITQGGESHKASVEDADEGGSSGGNNNNNARVEKSDKKNAESGVKYWLSERSVGEFSRTFNFPSPVDQDSVSASFKDGILNIIVPKTKKQGARRIAIN